MIAIDQVRGFRFVFKIRDGFTYYLGVIEDRGSHHIFLPFEGGRNELEHDSIAELKRMIGVVYDA